MEDAHPPETHRAADTEALLASLDTLSRARGSAELFDALLEENVEKLAVELGRHPTHFLRPDLVRWLAARGHRPQDLPSPTDLLLAEVEERLGAQEKRIRELSAEVERLSAIGLGSKRVTEAYGAMIALFVGMAILGWASAFGLLPFTPEGPTPLRPVDEPITPPTHSPGGSH